MPQSFDLLRLVYTSLLLYLMSLMISCESQAPPNRRSIVDHSKSTQTVLESTDKTHEQSVSKAKQSVWLFVGDSLTAGFGLAPDESYVAVLERQLQAEGQSVLLRNGGVSGDTSAGVKRRLAWLLKDPPEVMFLCIGANDGMRGQSIEALTQNLIDIVTSARQAGVQQILLMGMRLPPNYGVDYTRRFEEVYPAVAQQLKIPLMPFLLEGVAGNPSLNLSDGIHPNAQGHQQIANAVKSFITKQGLLRY